MKPLEAVSTEIAKWIRMNQDRKRDPQTSRSDEITLGIEIYQLETVQSLIDLVKSRTCDCCGEVSEGPLNEVKALGQRLCNSCLHGLTD